MKKRNNNTFSNFYIEIIIVILFFSVASVILTRIFIYTAYTNKLNSIRNNSIVHASSVIDVYKNTKTIEESLKEVINNCTYTKKEHVYTVRLDEEMNYSKNGSTILVIEESIDETRAGSLKTVSLKYRYKQRELYVIEGKKYEEK